MSRVRINPSCWVTAGHRRRSVSFLRAPSQAFQCVCVCWSGQLKVTSFAYLGYGESMHHIITSVDDIHAGDVLKLRSNVGVTLEKPNGRRQHINIDAYIPTQNHSARPDPELLMRNPELKQTVRLAVPTGTGVSSRPLLPYVQASFALCAGLFCLMCRPLLPYVQASFALCIGLFCLMCRPLFPMPQGARPRPCFIPDNLTSLLALCVGLFCLMYRSLLPNL